MRLLFLQFDRPHHISLLYTYVRNYVIMLPKLLNVIFKHPISVYSICSNS